MKKIAAGGIIEKTEGFLVGLQLNDCFSHLVELGIWKKDKKQKGNYNSVFHIEIEG